MQSTPTVTRTETKALFLAALVGLMVGVGWIGGFLLTF